MNRPPSPTLLAAYLERRPALVRFFTARLGSAEAAEDLVQELYLKVVATDPRDEIRNPAAFLYRLGQNLLLDRLRQQRRSRTRDDAWYQSYKIVLGGQDVADLPDPDAALAARRRIEIILAGLRELPPRTRQVFRLHKFDGLTHPEVAAELGISRSAVEKHISAALAHLLTRLGTDRGF